MATVIFVQNIWFEFLGTMALIGYLRHRGHQADILIGTDKKLIAELRTRQPEIVAFSVVTGYHHWALHLARSIKTWAGNRVTIVMGGPHCTFFPEIIQQPEVDVVCRGEGEEALADLADAIQAPETWAQIPNLWTKHQGHFTTNPVRPLLADLDQLPFPVRDGYYRYAHIRDNPVKRFISGRGCPYACSFCFNHSYQELYAGAGQYVRKRSPENVIAELREVVQRYPLKTIRFEDDLFGVFKPWLRSFLSLYQQEIKLPYICSFRADHLTDEVVRLLKESGCINVVFGVETGNEQLRNDVLQKNLTDSHIQNAAHILNSYKLNFCTTNILGVPYETWDDSLTTVTFNLKLKPRFTWCSIFQPYPRTALGARLLRECLVHDLDLDNIDANYHSSSVLLQKDINRSVNLHKFFYVIFHHPWTLPLIAHLCKLPPNPLFLLIHRFSFMFIFAERWNVSISRAFLEGIRSSGFHKKSAGLGERAKRLWRSLRPNQPNH